jgi:hypothetical protein
MTDATADPNIKVGVPLNVEEPEKKGESDSLYQTLTNIIILTKAT